MSPAAVSITQLEPVVYLRGQSATGEDARGRRRPINVDAPPSQLRGLVTVYLPKPCKIREISISLTGIARTDWPEGIGPNKVELVEEVTIFKQITTLFDAKVEGSVPGRKRSNSVGPGIGLNDEVDWDLAAANASSGQQRAPSGNGSNNAARGSGSARKEEPSTSGNLARQLAGAAAKAGTAIIPPTLRPDLNLSKSKNTSSIHNTNTNKATRPSLNRTGSGTTSWSHQGNATAATDAGSRSPPLQLPSSQSAGSSSRRAPREGLGSFTDLFAREASLGPRAQDGLAAAESTSIDRAHGSSSALPWNGFLEAPGGQERPPGYASRSAPLFGYDSWPSTSTVEPPSDLSPSSEVGSPLRMPGPGPAALWSGGNVSHDAYPSNSRNSTAPSSPTMSRAPFAAPSKSILSSQTQQQARPKEQTVRFDNRPPPALGPASPLAGASASPSASTSSSSVAGAQQATPSPGRSAPASRRNSVEVQERDKASAASKLKQASKGAADQAKGKKTGGLKGLIGGLLKEHDGKSEDDAGAAAESKEFKKGTYTFLVCISLPANLPPTLHADFGFNKYVLKATVNRSGALTPNLAAEKEIKLIHAPDEDALDETDSIVVERSWEDVLSYMVVLSGKSFPFGRKIPLWLKFVPQGKVRIHKITATLEERTDYFAKGRRMARHEVPRKWTMLKVANEGSSEPLLPIVSDSASALQRSPLAAMAEAAAGDDPQSDALPSIMDPNGPWELAADLDLPDHRTTRINLSTNHAKSNIAVHHLIRVMIRVEKPDGFAAEAAAAGLKDNERHKMYDIIIEAPITLTSLHTADEWMNLPNYWSLAADDGAANDVDAIATVQPLAPASGPVSPRPLAAPPGLARAIPRPALPTPVMGLSGPPPSPLAPRSPPARDRHDGISNGPTPQRVSQRWLALSSSVGAQDARTAARSVEGVVGSATRSTCRGAARGGGPVSALGRDHDSPPPAYEANARQGERVVASTRLGDTSRPAAAESSAPSATNLMAAH